MTVREVPVGIPFGVKCGLNNEVGTFIKMANNKLLNLETFVFAFLNKEDVVVCTGKLCVTNMKRED